MKFKIYMLKNSILFWVLLLNTCLLCGQVQQKEYLTEANYGKWGQLSLKSISGDGLWTSFTMNYENKLDTLFLLQTRSKKLFSFPKAKNGLFAGTTIFSYLTDDTLILKKLDGGKDVKIEEVKSYDYWTAMRVIVAWKKDGSLNIINSSGVLITKVEDVTKYALNDASGVLCYIIAKNNVNTIGCIQFKPLKQILIATGNTRYSSILFQQNGKALVFFNEKTLQHYSFDDDKLVSFSIENLQKNGYDITEGSFAPLKISKNGENVFFNVIERRIQEPQKKDLDVEVWNGNDNTIYEAQASLSAIAIPRLAVWFPAGNDFKILSEKSRYKTRISGLDDYVILSDPLSYGKSPTYYENVDYYIKDVRTGIEELLLKKQSHDPKQLCFSPLDNSVLYYRDKNWWVYKPETDETLNITKLIPTNWDNDSEIAPHQFETYGVAGFTVDGKSVLVYDSNDIWKIEIDGTGYKRLTKGREEHRKYKIDQVEYEENTSKLFDLSKDVFLSFIDNDNYKSGFGIYNLNNGMRELASGAYYSSEIKKSKKGQVVFTTETFDKSTTIMKVSIDDGKIQKLFDSNKQQNHYYWGKSELIHYTNSAGQLLKGALYYPANFDTSKKYPMIVHIYEKQSQGLYRYRNPTLLNYEGFNITNFTLNGYFVLLPDIEYTLGMPAVSANDCVLAAVKSVVLSGKIDESRIGLIGHSFGGYETNFLITQSQMFAAAVSGAGISNTITHYFDLGFSTVHKDSMWWYESQQFRMGSSFFLNKEGFLKNSPIMQADKIRTPLLLWAGKNDKIISFKQSVAFYMALRRLRLPTILLAYPDEDHTLTIKKNQIDLTDRILQWFDYYLKNKKESGWIKTGTLPD